MILIELAVVEVVDSHISLMIGVIELQLLNLMIAGKLIPSEGHGSHPDSVSLGCGEGVVACGYIFLHNG